MAGVIGTAFIDVRPDMTGFGKEVQAGTSGAEGDAEEAGKRTGTAFGGGMKTTLAVAAGSLIANFAQQGLAKVTEFIGGSIDEASNLSETLNKIGVVFGENSGQVTAWAQNAATQFGMSKNEALGAAGTFGDMFKQLGLGGKEAAGTSESMIKLAADLGSFHNVDPSDVLERLSAAFRGEYDPIQKLIPGITAARVEHEALGMSGKTSAKDLTALDKALATQKILMEDSANATDDFSETSGGLANQQRIASAQFKDLQANLGQFLLPIMATLMKVINDGLVPAFTALFGWIADHQDVVQALAIGLGAVGVVILISLIPAFLAWAAAAFTAAAATLLALAPLILIGAAVAALAYLIINNWDTIKAATEAVWNAILGAVTAVWDWITGNWPLLLAILTGPFGLAVKWIIDNWSGITNFFTALPGRIGGFLAGLPGQLRDLGVSMVRSLIDGISSMLGWVGNKVGELPGIITGAVTGLAGVLYDAGRKVVQGFIDGIGSMFGSVKDKLGDLTGALTSWKGPEDRDRKLLYGSGQLIIGGFVAGLESQYGAVAASLSGLTTAVGAAGPTAGAVNVSPLAAGAGRGPAVVIQHATFTDQMDVETFMRQAAWVAQTQLV